MLDLDGFKKCISRFQENKYSSEIGMLNDACWVAERGHLLIAEIEKLRKLNEELVDACKAGLENVLSQSDSWAASKLQDAIYHGEQYIYQTGG